MAFKGNFLLPEHYLKSELDILLKTNANILQWLDESIVDGMWYWDLEKPENEWMSPKFWEVLGHDYRSKSHLSSEWQDLIFAEDLVLVRENFNKHINDPQHPYDQVVRFHHLDGSTVWIRCRGLAIRDAAGNATRMLGVHQNISEERRFEAELKNANERFELAALGASVGIWDWFDMDEGREYWSPKFYHMLGYTSNEIEASLDQFKALLHPDDTARTFELLERHFDSGIPFQIDYRIRNKQGKYRWFHGSGYASRDATGKPQRMVGTIEDIHARKEGELKQKKLLKQLESTNKELEQFVHHISHDLKEPLRTLNSVSSMLMDDLAKDNQEEVQKHLGFIKHHTKRMTHMVDDILELTNITNNQLEKQPIEASLAIENVSLSLMRMINQHQAKLTLPKQKVLVLADPNLFELLIQNLLTNAIKFHAEDKAPQINVSLEVTKSGDVLLSVQDQGIGIKVADQENVFMAFKKLNARTEFEGTGFGLTIVKKIVERHHWKMELDSTPGIGSTFIVRIPKRITPGDSNETLRKAI